MKNIPKPIEPKPEDFNLTVERLKIFEDSVHTKTPINNKVYTIGGILAFLSAGVVIYALCRSVLITIFVTIFLWGFIAVFIFIGICELILASANKRWRIRQPDYSAYSNYIAAKKEYAVLYGEWLRTQEEWWQRLSGRGFEQELTKLFNNRGYKARWTGKTGDEGVDLVIENNKRRILIQCKAHNKPIGPATIRDLYGTLIHNKGEEAWVISTFGFSEKAKEFAADKPIKLITIRDILENNLKE